MCKMLKTILCSEIQYWLCVISKNNMVYFCCDTAVQISTFGYAMAFTYNAFLLCLKNRDFNFISNGNLTKDQYHRQSNQKVAIWLHSKLPWRISNSYKFLLFAILCYRIRKVNNDKYTTTSALF